MPRKPKEPPALIKQCGLCEHFQPYGPDRGSDGECFESPPHVGMNPEDGSAFSVRPQVSHDDRACSRFKLRVH